MIAQEIEMLEIVAKWAGLEEGRKVIELGKEGEGNYAERYRAARLLEWAKNL